MRSPWKHRAPQPGSPWPWIRSVHDLNASHPSLPAGWTSHVCASLQICRFNPGLWFDSQSVLFHFSFIFRFTDIFTLSWKTILMCWESIFPSRIQTRSGHFHHHSKGFLMMPCPLDSRRCWFFQTLQSFLFHQSQKHFASSAAESQPGLQPSADVQKCSF